MRTVSPFQCVGEPGRLQRDTKGRYGPMTDPYRPCALRVSASCISPFRASAYFTARIRLSEGEDQTARASPKPEASRVRACQAAEGMSPSACSP
ncbi:hypothetical protein SCYAM73S_04934 [Streptomyces cyaneofuscatus]|nr:hypothetical protein STIB_12180 [Streptomyces sp. IB2014 011-1]